MWSCAPLLVGLAHLLGGDVLVAGERVDDRRLADARRAEQDGGLVLTEERTHLVEPLTVRAETVSTGQAPRVANSASAR